MSVDLSHVATWTADGLVVSSPTGSTGYSFSAGGPILDPTSRNLVVSAIAAYLTAVRTFVADPTHVVSVRVVDAFDSLVSIDGRIDVPLHVGDVVRWAPVPSLSASSSRTAPSRSGSCCDRRRSCCPPRMALLELTVTDLALIDRARVTLAEGFTVITGETGAGKSLLIDALLLVSGGRADAGAVRAGAPMARVEALFDRPAGHGQGSDEPLICVREVAPGRTVARIDDQAVPVARLATVEPLVAVHGQHEQQRLLSPARQRELLDATGDHAALLATVGSACARLA
ncbi:MAG: AAA family ATPase [Chloroflexota bacterium]